MKKIGFMCFLLLGILFASCSQISDDVSNLENRNETTKEIAQKYVKYKNVWGNFEKGRSATAEQVNVYPDFLFNIELYDENGNPIKFEDFSDEQKEQFYLAWQEEEVNHCVEVLEDNEELQKQVLLDNIAIEEALKTAERNAFVDNSYSLFLKKYLDVRKELLEKNSDSLNLARGSSSSYGEITSDCLNKRSLNKLRSIYRQGLVLYTADAAGSSTSYFSGHAAITKEDKWNTNWDKDGLSTISYSAWGDSKPTWKDKSNGVQEEPIGFWAGTAESSANHVCVMQMCYPKVVVKFKWIFPYLTIDYFAAPKSDAERAVNFAEKQKGKPYDIAEDITVTLIDTSLIGSNIVKWKTDNFYCSQLVWRSWVSVSPKYDFSGLRPLVLPADFELAPNTKILTTYYNK